LTSRILYQAPGALAPTLHITDYATLEEHTVTSHHTKLS
jgi:hypothetical protein